MRANYSTYVTPQFRVLSDDQIRDIHRATLEVLEHTGVVLKEPESVALLQGAGARVEKDRVRIPSFLVEEAIRTAPKQVLLYNRDGDKAIVLDDHRSYFGGIFDTPGFIDPFTHERRPFLSTDYRMSALVNDYCPNIHWATWAGDASDFPPPVRDQLAFKMVLPYTKKPIGVNALNESDLTDLFDMAAVVAGGCENLCKRPFVFNTAEPITPLLHRSETIRKVLLCAQLGIPIVYYGMPAAGATAPSSFSGLLVVGNAEILSGLVIHQLKARGAPFVYGFMPSHMDMRTTVWCYGAPEFALLCSAVADIAHYYNLPMYGTAGCGDSQEMDEQAAVETTMTCLMSALSGANLVHDVGLLGGADVLSLELIVLTDEVLDMITKIMGGIEVSPETLAVDLIDKVGPGGTYLTEEHTLKNFRRFWYPKLFYRNRYDVWSSEGRPNLREKLNRKTREIIEQHQVDPLPDDVLKELAVLEKRWMVKATDI